MTATGSVQPAHRYRILCVDDNEFGVYVNATILRSEGYEVFACTDPLQAAALAQSEEIDLAVLDYQMPVMNGAELGALCKAANPDMKVILFSGWLGMPRLELAFADLFVQKSEGIQALLEGMQALLAHGEMQMKSASRELSTVKS